jgi:hypothetical protein
VAGFDSESARRAHLATVTAGLTIADLGDVDPPMMADWVWDKNTDTRLYDILGRSYTLSLSLEY